jgi:Na+-transporting NADH:ubiquinone oxidoreductase subunit NqrB
MSKSAREIFTMIWITIIGTVALGLIAEAFKRVSATMCWIFLLFLAAIFYVFMLHR